MMYFVGVGPGDPELITMKAVRILQQADAIILPDSGKDSVTLRIIENWIRNKPVHRVYMPMHGTKQAWRSAHIQAVEYICDLLGKYKCIAYPVLGDPGIYASGNYLMQQISLQHPYTVIPGVPSMCAAAAALGIPLCKQHEDMLVTDTLEPDPRPVNTTTVYMKSGKKLSALKESIAEADAYAVQNLGMADQWIGKLEDYPNDTASYFTTVIVKPRCPEEP